MRTVVETRLAIAADQLEIGLMHQRGGVQGVAVLPGQLAARHAVQLLVQGGEHVVQRGPVAVARRFQEQGDVGGVGHGVVQRDKGGI